MKRSTIVEAIALLFIILFLYTGISKLMEYDIAVEQIVLTPRLAPAAKTIVIILPVIEILTAIALFIPQTRKYGLWASLALMILFTGYVTYIINYNDQLPCTCGGVLEQLSWPQHLILNTVFIILAIIGILLLRKIRNGHFDKQTPLRKHRNIILLRGKNL
jgi:uncharacterized membrane protein YphA (DoxX/SURF4 family)